MGVVIFIVIAGLILWWVTNVHESVEKENKMWEIFVPASSKQEEFSYAHHKQWDEYVKSLAGGLTIMKSAKGEWIDDSTNKLYKDKIIPVRIKCSKKNIKKIVKFTIQHYNQEAVLAYKVSDKVILTHKREL